MAHSACILQYPQGLPQTESLLLITNLEQSRGWRQNGDLLLLCDLARIMDTDVRAPLLTSIPPLYLGLLILTAYLVIARVRQYCRLSHFKGPATSGISWWWHSKAVLSGQAQRYYGDVTEKYGRSGHLVANAAILIEQAQSHESRLSTS